MKVLWNLSEDERKRVQLLRNLVRLQAATQNVLSYQLLLTLQEAYYIMAINTKIDEMVNKYQAEYLSLEVEEEVENDL